MKNCLFLKFLALMLCAVCLMNFLGSAVSMLVLVENDLYNKTVDQVIAQRVEDHAAAFSVQTAYRYADQTLGRCPPEVSRYGYASRMPHNYTNYGYAILDAEGNVLESLNPELKDITQTHTYPITGQYMYLVSTQTESQAREAAAQKQLQTYRESLVDSDGTTVPPEGVAVNHVIFTDREGRVLYEASSDGMTGSSSYFYRDYLLENGNVDNFANSYPDHISSQTGFLFYNTAGHLVYTSFLEEQEKPFQTTVYGVLFHSGSKDFTFQAEDPDGIGILSNESGYLLFTSFAAPETVPEEATETAEETEATQVTETTIPEETLSEETTVDETITEETTAEETIAETEAAVYDETEGDAAETEGSTEEFQEPSSASAEPAEADEQEYSQGDSENVASDDAAEAIPEENPASDTQEEQRLHIAQEVQKRIVLEWLLAKGLIAEDDVPAEILPDELFYQALMELQIITSIPETTSAEGASDALSEENRPILINGKSLDNYQINQTEYYDSSIGEYVTAKYVYLPMPELTVEVYVGPEVIQDAGLYNILRILRDARNGLLPILIGNLLLFILSAIYLFTAAGRSPKNEEIRAGGINRMPLDLYLLLDGILCTVLTGFLLTGIPILLNYDFMAGCSLGMTAIYLVCLILICFFFAAVAQIKTGNGFWWRRLLSVRLIFLFMRYAEIFCIWLKEKALPALIRFAKKIGQVSLKSLFGLHEHTQKLLFRIGKVMDRFFSLIPMTWQWMICGIALLCLLLIACNVHSLLLILICLIAALGIILYGTHCFGVLLESTRKMGKGDLNAKVDNRFMIGCFWDFARELNNLANVANVAAQKQLKSERMKTELITNVSHDIKTPLTSIINYVDLLQKPHTAEDEAQYLDVLDRQSQRLKKLVDDLMDMSKASTGNMAVEVTTVDVVESVNQALGEFSDKLDRAQLYPVFRHAEESVPIIADGKLVWRVLSNLLSNIVKYAMPRTRIYLDLTRMNGKVILSLKNISKEPLNINAEELMERFVRGDISRNTEGSGLGLNIAKSLMELQNGQLQILVDGDLFKVTLIFPDGR